MARMPEALDITLPDGRVIRVGLKTVMKTSPDCPSRQHLRVDCPADDPAEHRAPCICDRVANGTAWHTAECEASWTA